MNLSIVLKCCSLYHLILYALTGKKKKGALKNSHETRLVGPVKVLEAAHTDGRPLLMEVEVCVRRDTANNSTSHDNMTQSLIISYSDECSSPVSHHYSW